MKIFNNKKNNSIGLWIIIILLIGLIVYFTFQYFSLETFVNNNEGNLNLKTIYTYWHEDPLPESIEKFVKGWKKHNPDYKVVVLHDGILKDYLPDTDFSWTNSHQHKADLIRLEILATYGGIWSDASIICHSNYDWIIESLNSGGNEFVGYYLDGFTSNEKYPVIENWFFACRKDSMLVKKWRDEFKRVPTFSSKDVYINHLEKVEHIDLQKIPNDLKSYLASHCSLQKVLQTNPPYKMQTLKAEDGPYRPITDANWDSGKAIDNIISLKYQNVPMIKLRGEERKILIERSKNQNIDNIF